MISNFYLSVAARTLVRADPSLRYTSMLLGRQPTNKQTATTATTTTITLPITPPATATTTTTAAAAAAASATITTTAFTTATSTTHSENCFGNQIALTIQCDLLFMTDY